MPAPSENFQNSPHHQIEIENKPYHIEGTRFCWCDKCKSWECDCKDIEIFKNKPKQIKPDEPLPPVKDRDNSLRQYELIPQYKLDKINPESHIIISRDYIYQNRTLKKYYEIDSLAILENEIRKNNNLYEVIRTDKPRKLFFDLEWIDGKLEKDNETIVEIFINYVKDFMNDYFDCGDEVDIAISGCEYLTKFNGKENMKFSRHLVFNYNQCFKNHEDCNDFVKKFMYDFICKIPVFNYEGKCIMDDAVYGRNQNMKMIKQSKINKNKGTQNPINFLNEPEKHLCGIYEKELPFFDIDSIKKLFRKETKDKKTEKENTKKEKTDFSNVSIGDIHKRLTVKLCIPDGQPSTDLKYLLDSIPNVKSDWEFYFGIACCIKNCEESENKNYPLFEEWSAKNTDVHNKDYCWQMYRSITRRNEGRKYDKRTLIKMAERCNPKVGEIKAIIYNLTTTEITENVFLDDYDDKYCKEFPNVPNLVVKAGLGKGKTTQCIKFVNDRPESSVVIFSPRILFAKAICAEFNRELTTGDKFVCYTDVDTMELEASTRVVISPQSLFKLKGMPKWFDIVIMDECESVLSEFTQNTMKIPKNINAVLDSYVVFEKIMKYSKYNILCDAFISNRTLTFLNHITNKQKIHYMINNSQPIKREAIEYIDYKKFQSEMTNDIWSRSKNVVFYCDSKDKIIKTSEYHPTNDKHLYIHGQSSVKVRNTTDDVNTHWKGKKLLAYNSTITVGINYQNKDYDRLYLYGSVYCANVRNIFQSSMRIRHLKENLMVYNLMAKEYKKTNYDRYICYEDALDNLLDKVSRVKSHGEDVVSKWLDPPMWLIELTAFENFEKSVNKYYFKELFEYYLVQNNYEKKNEFNEVDESIDDDSESIEINYNEISIPFGFDASLKDKRPIYLLQKCKFFFDKYINSQELPKDKINMLFRKYVNSHNLILTSTFWNIITEKKKSEDIVLREDIQTNKYAIFAKETAMKLKEVKTLIKKIGLNNSTDCNTVITRKKMTSLVSYIKKKESLYKSLFKIRDQGKKKEDKDKLRNTVDNINKVLKNWSGFSLKGKKKGGECINYKLTLLVDKMDIAVDIIGI